MERRDDSSEEGEGVYSIDWRLRRVVGSDQAYHTDMYLTTFTMECEGETVVADFTTEELRSFVQQLDSIKQN